MTGDDGPADRKVPRHCRVTAQLPSCRTVSAVPALMFAKCTLITVQYGNAYPSMRINAVSPGFTATDFTDGAASSGPAPVDFSEMGIQSVEEGAEIIVRMATVAPDGPTGGFFEVSGPAPW